MSYFLRKKWMVNLSGSGKILWALNMKKDSYPYLICMTVSGLIFIFLFFWWRADIYRVTFLNQSISHYYILFSMGIAFLLSLFWVKKGIVKQSGWKSLSAYLKVYAGMCIFAGFFLIIPLTTLTYFLPGETSSYVAPYRYTSGSSKISIDTANNNSYYHHVATTQRYGNHLIHRCDDRLDPQLEFQQAPGSARGEADA